MTGTWVGAALGLISAAGLTIGAGLLTDPDNVWGFVAVLGIALALSVAAIWVAHRGLRSAPKQSLTQYFAILVTVIAYVVFLPLLYLAVIRLAAGLGSFA
jgi:uncharacterized membrane protein